MRRNFQQRAKRPWVDCQRDLEALRPANDKKHDLTRGEQRFAAEVALAQLWGRNVPTWAIERAGTILRVIARG